MTVPHAPVHTGLLLLVADRFVSGTQTDPARMRNTRVPSLSVRLFVLFNAAAIGSVAHEYGGTGVALIRRSVGQPTGCAPCDDFNEPSSHLACRRPHPTDGDNDRPLYKRKRRPTMIGSDEHRQLQAELQTLCAARAPALRGGEEAACEWRIGQIIDWFCAKGAAAAPTATGAGGLWGRILLEMTLEALLTCAQCNASMPLPPVVAEWLRQQCRAYLLSDPAAQLTWGTVMKVLDAIRTTASPP